MKPQTQTRFTNALLAALIVPLGLATRPMKAHYPVLGDMLGDALWATMVFFIAGLLFPHFSVLKRAFIALAFAFCIEFSQLYHRPWIDEIRSTTLGAMILGFNFAWQDLFCYAAGIVIGIVAVGVLASTAKNVRA
jgi:hypothetical protein